MSTVAHLEQLAGNVIDGVLKQNELARTVMEFTDESGRRLSSADTPSRHDYVKVVIMGETLLLGLIPEDTDERFVARLRSELIDFIAESRFGWGEWRK